jgi:hypothetical protein
MIRRSGETILDRKYVPFSSCQTTLKSRKKIEEFGSFFSSALQAWKLAAQRFAYGLWRFRCTFLSTETKAGYGAKTLLIDVHPP